MSRDYLPYTIQPTPESAIPPILPPHLVQNFTRFLSTLRYAPPIDRIDSSDIQWNEWTWRGLQSELIRFHISLRESEDAKECIIGMVEAELARLQREREESNLSSNRESSSSLRGERDDEEDIDDAETIINESPSPSTHRSPVVANTGETDEQIASRSNPPSQAQLTNRRRSLPAPHYFHPPQRRTSIQTYNSTTSTLIYTPTHRRHRQRPRTRYRKAFVGLCKAVELFLPLDVDVDKVLGPFERRRIARVSG